MGLLFSVRRVVRCTNYYIYFLGSPSNSFFFQTWNMYRWFYHWPQTQHDTTTKMACCGNCFCCQCCCREGETRTPEELVKIHTIDGPSGHLLVLIKSWHLSSYLCWTLLSALCWLACYTLQLSGCLLLSSNCHYDLKSIHNTLLKLEWNRQHFSL